MTAIALQFIEKPAFCGPSLTLIRTSLVWLLIAKTTLFFELVEYAMVLHIRFSNVTLDYYWKRDN